MSFKRTSCISPEEKSGLDLTCHLHPRSELEALQPIDHRYGDVALSTVVVSTNADDTQFPTLISSSTVLQPESFEPECLTMREVHPRQEVLLVARDCSIADDKHVLERSEGRNGYLDLQSERNCVTETWKEIDQQTTINSCCRCFELAEVISKQDLEIANMRKKHDDLTHKHARFVMSNCHLNEDNDRFKIENDQLKMENDRLKLTLSDVKYEASQLRSVNEDLQRMLASRTNQRLERNRIGSSPSCFTNSASSHSDQVNTGESYPFTVRDDLKEAIFMSREQQVYLTRLQEQLVYQNQRIKILCSLLQRSSDGCRKLADIRNHCEELTDATMSGAEQSSTQGQYVKTLDKFLSALPHKAGNMLDIQDIVEDYGATLMTKDEEDIYSRAALSYGCPDAKLQTRTQSNMCADPFVNSSHIQIKGVEKLEQGPKITNNTKLSGARLESTTSFSSRTETTPHVLGNRDLPSQREVVACPICNQEFVGGSEDIEESFRKHLDECLEERLCPMCFKKFPKSVTQTDFEKHVNKHFHSGSLDFEVLKP